MSLRDDLRTLMNYKPEGASAPTNEVDLYEDLHRLASTWRRETAHLSSTTDQAMHPAYQRIIGHGPAALIFIFQQLQQQTGHWFWALRAITGADPVAEENRGNVEAMRQAWLEWGRAHHYI